MYLQRHDYFLPAQKMACFRKHLRKVIQNLPQIIVYGSLIFILSVAGGFKQLAVLASAAILLIYLSVILAAIKLRTKKQDASEKTFRIPGGLIIPFIGIAAIVWLLTSLTKWEILSALIFIAVVVLIYFVMKMYKKEKN